ncbi:hypothetical protein BCR36DRAFT_584836 [Piromyces finnis]|uniref:Uncharacterized protein n=1 Tax=Piromyces finnis TaxID=1754191 RepID=A0A1Y1V6M3_9FUNG|nr:hypothetical protein BCR36DRAFT_584836 [Piromyces finnis]|eukprot:ORX47322.1 hypothetical protein BCR36DRAFT_584836 [Piromyces finnis]
MRIMNLFQKVLLLLAIYNCEAKKHQDESKNENLVVESQKIIVNCKEDSHCTNFDDFLTDMAVCNVTDYTCTNYCMVKIPCTNDLDCNYSIGDKKKCGVSCHKNLVNDTIGMCLIVNKQGQFCNNNHIICEDNLICDFYSDTCITKAEAQNQSGEPLFSLFLFMLIMLSLFNRQRADEDFLNNMAPNELLMVTLPNRRHQPEDDILPVYQPLDGNNEDEVIEQNIAPNLSESEGPTTNEQHQSNEDGEMVLDDDDLPLLPPTYDEAVNGFAEDSNNNLINNSEQEPQNNNS